MTARLGRVEIVIDELVLHGFDPRQRDQIAESLRGELAVALEGWSPLTGSDATYVAGGSFPLPAGSSPATVGRGAASQIRLALQRRTEQAPSAAPTAPPATGQAS